MRWLASSLERCRKTRELAFLASYLLGALVIISISLMYQQGDFDRRMILAESESRAEIQRAAASLELMLDSPRLDILRLSGLVDHALESHGQNREALRLVSEGFKRLMAINPGYEKIRYLDVAGKEVINVVRQGSNIEIQPVNALQDKSDRYYVTRTLELDNGQVYISPMDYAMEKDQVLIPLRLLIRVCSPVFAHGGLQGLVVISLSGSAVVDRLRGAVKESNAERMMLLNASGQWLHHPKSSLTHDVALGGGHNVAGENPELFRRIRESRSGVYRDGDGSRWFFETVRFNTETHEDTYQADRQSHLNDLRVLFFLSSSEVQALRWKSMEGVAFWTGGALLAWLLPAWIFVRVRQKEEATRKEILFANEMLNEALEENQRSQAQVEQILNSLSGPAWMIDDRYRLLACNQAYHQFMLACCGIAPMLGQSVLARSDPDWHQHYGRVMQGERFSLVEMARRNDARQHMEYSFLPLKSVKEKVFGAVMYGVDVTHHLDEQEKIEALKQRYENLVNSVGGIVWEADADTLDFTFVSKRARDVLGYPQEDWFEPGFWASILHPEDREGAIHFCKVQTRLGQPHEFDYRVLDARGNVVWLRDIVGAATYTDGRRIIQGMMLDISAQRRAEAEKERLEKSLIQAQKMESIGLLAGGIAHDFNNILAAMLGYAELSKEASARQKHEQINRYMDMIIHSGERARDLVRQLLSFSRAQETNASVIKIGPLVREWVALIRASAPSSIIMEVQVADGLPCVCINPTHLHQIFMNLCLNAKQAMAMNGHLRITVEHVDLGNHQTCSSCHQAFAGELVRFVVSDTGEGIAEQNLNRIFEPFFSTRTVGEGTGLGLSVVHGIAHTYGGHVTVQSHPGQGTTISLFLPLCDGVPDSTPSKTWQAMMRLDGCRVLLVDDDPIVQSFMKEALEQSGASIVIAGTGMEAINRILSEKYRFDLLITDQVMPVMTGSELASRVAEIAPDIPVIICTGYFNSEMDVRVAGNIRAILAKPLSISQLLAESGAVLSHHGRDHVAA